MGPPEITLTTPIKTYLQRFIYGYLQKRSFVLGCHLGTENPPRRLFCWNVLQSLVADRPLNVR